MREWIKKHDLVTRALCLGGAILLWFYVASVQNPEKTVPVSGVKVSLIGLDTLEANNLMVLNEGTFTVTINVEGKRDKLAEVLPERITAKADVSNIQTTGRIGIPYKVELNVDNVTVVGRSPAYINVEVDRKVTETVPVTVNQTGSAGEGYVYETMAAEPSSIVVEGPQSVVSTIAGAYVSVNTDRLQESVDGAFEYTLVDHDGKAVDTTHLVCDTQVVNLSMAVRRVKEIPLQVQLVSAPGIDAKYAEAVISPDVIEVSGTERVLETLNQISLGSIDLREHFLNGKSVELPITLPNGVKNMSGETSATITINLTDIEVRNYNVTNFSYINAPEGAVYDVVSAPVISVMIYGHKEVLDAIDSDMVSLVADIEGAALEPGRHNVKAHVVIEGSPDVGVVSDYELILDVKNE